MDVAPINIETKNGTHTLDCSMPNFGNISVIFYVVSGNIFCQLSDYPIVTASVGGDLYLGLNTPYKFKILPTSGGSDELTISNINSFWVGVEEK